jgi:hypothetical protein
MAKSIDEMKADIHKVWPFAWAHKWGSRREVDEGWTVHEEINQPSPIGHGLTELEAWADACSKLPTPEPQEAAPQAQDPWESIKAAQRIANGHMKLMDEIMSAPQPNSTTPELDGSEEDGEPLCIHDKPYHGYCPGCAKDVASANSTAPERPLYQEDGLGDFHYEFSPEAYMDALEAKLMKQAAKMGVLQFRAETAEAAVAQLRAEMERITQQWKDSVDEARDAILNERFGLAESGIESDQVNAVIGIIDDYAYPPLPAPPSERDTQEER